MPSLFKPHMGKLTDPAGINEVLKQTYAGMAHFAGTGPKGVTCRQCKNWEGSNKERYKSGKKAGSLLDAKCSRGTGVEVPHNAAACKYFETNDFCPPIFREQTHGIKTTDTR